MLLFLVFNNLYVVKIIKLLLLLFIDAFRWLEVIQKHLLLYFFIVWLIRVQFILLQLVAL